MDNHFLFLDYHCRVSKEINSKSILTIGLFVCLTFSLVSYFICLVHLIIHV